MYTRRLRKGSRTYSTFTSFLSLSFPSLSISISIFFPPPLLPYPLPCMMHVPVGIRWRLAGRVETNLSANSTSTPVPSSGPSPIELSTSVKSLIGVLIVLGAILVGP
jgi:hypothetical protein